MWTPEHRQLACWLSSSVLLRPGSRCWRQRFWHGTAPTRRAAVLRRSPASVSSPRRRWSRRSAMARSSARADSSRPGSVSCPDNTRAAARTGWGEYRSAGMAISGACSCMVRERCCAGAAPSRVRVPAGPTNCWRGGPQTSCWSPWPIRQPASPGHCSRLRTGARLTSWKAATNLRGYDDGETGQHPRSAKPEALSEHQAR